MSSTGAHAHYCTFLSIKIQYHEIFDFIFYLPDPSPFPSVKFLAICGCFPNSLFFGRKLSTIAACISKLKPLTVKKGQRFSRPQLGCHLPNSPWPGIIKLFPARESLISDPAGDGRISNLFLQCTV